MSVNKDGGRIEKASHIIEVLQTRNQSRGHLNDLVSHTCFIMKRVFGSAAYRQFDLVRSKPVRNLEGSLRGGVKSLRWRVAFDRLNSIGLASETVGDVLDVEEAVLDFAHGLLGSWHHMRAEMNSGDTWDAKSAKVSTQIVSICLRAALFKYKSTALNAVHDVARGVHAGSWAGGVLGCNVTNPGRSRQFVDFVNARVDSWADSITDGDNIYRVVNTYINLPLEHCINFSDHESPLYGSPRERYMQSLSRRGSF